MDDPALAEKRPNPPEPVAEPADRLVWRHSPMRAPVSRAAEGLARRAFTVAEVERMVEEGIIAVDERLEIIGGEIVPMSPKGPRHERLKTAINLRWGRVCPDDYVFAQETALRLSEHDYLEPDFIVFRRDKPLEGVKGPDVLLAVEVADSSRKYDLKRKPLIYADFGVRELWVIDVGRREVHVHLGPGRGGYAWKAVSSAGERLDPVEAPREFAFALDELELL